MQKARISVMRWPVAFALLLAFSAPAAFAQTGTTVQSLPDANDPAELLAQALRTLATEPSNLEALTAAGRNALILGDPNAALGFFGRASELAPRDGRVKAGLGSVLVQLEKPQEALRLFADASALGVPDEQIAADRGLAYDLTGDPRRAQRDYAIALAADPNDDDVRRSLALSQGISGDRAAAITTLDPLIRKRDIAGWRAQTFVLAMTGDAKGAGDITHIMMPSQAEMLQPFLERLSTLSPADKAKAVHFGEMPAAGRSYTPTELANTGTPATYAPSPARQPVERPAPKKIVPVPAPPPAAKPVPAPVQVAKPVPLPVQAPPVAATPVEVAAVQPSDLAPTPVAPAPKPAPVQPVPEPQPAPLPQKRDTIDNALKANLALGQPQQPTAAPLAGIALGTVSHVETLSAAPPPEPLVTKPAEPAPLPAPPLAPAPAKPLIGPPAEFADAGPQIAPLVAETPAVVAPAPKPVEAKPVAAPVKPAVEPKLALKSVSKPKSAEAKPEDEKPRPKARSKKDGDDDSASADKGKAKSLKPGKKSASDDSDDDSASPRKSKKSGKTDISDRADKSSKSDKSDKANTSKSKSNDKSKPDKDKPTTERVYVQVAGGANKDDMDKAWSGVKKKAPDLLKGKSPSTTPLRATNRLLVGPFKDEDEAQAFVNKMAGKGLSAFTFKSSKGQKVEKVGTGK